MMSSCSTSSVVAAAIAVVVVVVINVVAVGVDVRREPELGHLLLQVGMSSFQLLNLPQQLLCWWGVGIHFFTHQDQNLKPTQFKSLVSGLRIKETKTEEEAS